MAVAGPDRFTDETSVITCDMNGTVQQYSADAEALFDWTAQEVIGKMSVAWFHVLKNVPTLVPRLLREAIEKGKFEEEVTLMRKDGATFQAILTVRPVIRDGRQIGFMGMTKPLTPPTRVPVEKMWFQALRAPFLIASVIPVLVGALAAWTIRGAFNPSFFVLCLLGAMSIHLGANMANDAWDYRSGNDLAVRHLNPFAGGGRVLLRGVLSVRTHLLVALAFLAAGSLIGLYLVTQVGLPLFVLGLFGIAIAYVVLLVGVLFAGLTPWALLGLLALPLAARPVRGLRAAKDDPHALIPSNAAMILATLATGILLLVGLALSTI